MKRKNLVLAVGLICAACTQSFTASVGAIVTTETHFAPETRLIISAYGWEYVPPTKDATGKVVTPEERWLTYLQLFNASDTPVWTSDITLRVESLDLESMPSCTILLSCRTVLLSDVVGEAYIAPGKHLLVAEQGAVEGARFFMPAFRLPAYQKSTVPWFRMMVQKAGQRDVEVVAKLDSRTDVANEYSDWLRNENSSGTGYYESFTAFSRAPGRLFDDPLYTPPKSAPLTVVEVYPYSLEDEECVPGNTVVQCTDYIKIHVDKYADVENYVLRTSSNSSQRSSTNTFWLGHYTPSDDGYITVFQTDDGSSFTLSNDGGYVWFEDIYGLVRYDTTVRYPSAGTQQHGWSWMQHNDRWDWSTTPSPSGENVFVPYIPDVKTTECPEGKYLNPDTNRCRTVEEAVNALAACAEGQERNPLTNRCRSKVSVVAAAIAPCGEGQERNPLTHRCRSIASAVAELLPCDEGYERNPATKRCRKVLGASTNPSAAQSQKVESAKMNDTNLWLWALAAVGATGAVGVGVYEWRHEILGAGRKFAGRFIKK